MKDLILELKEEIIEVLNFEGMTPEDIDENAPLFGDGLGLDSIDALELIVLMEKKYGIKLADPNQGKKFLLPLLQWLLISQNTEQNNESTNCYYGFGDHLCHWEQPIGYASLFVAISKWHWRDAVS